MAVDTELLDRLLAGRDPKEQFSRDGLLYQQKKALSERTRNAGAGDARDGALIKAGCQVQRTQPER